MQHLKDMKEKFRMQSQPPPPPPVPPAPSEPSPSASSPSPSAASAAADLLSRLPKQHSFALGGLIAALLGRKSSYWSDAFCRQFLKRSAVTMLHLPAEQLEALLPIYEHCDIDAATALVSLLPNDEQERAALLLAVLALTILAEDAQLAGYDARSRQLLIDASHTLGVPWQRVAEMERQLAVSMRAQAASYASQEATSRVEGSAGAEPSNAIDAAADAADGKKLGLSSKWRKRIAVASIGIASGIVVGATAGLAAPAVLAGLGTVGTGIGGIGALGGVGATVGATIVATTAVLQGAIGVTVVTTLFGATGAGLASIKLSRRLGDVQEFEFAQPPPAAERATALHSSAAAAAAAPTDSGDEAPADAQDAASADGSDGLVVCICVSGWLVGDTDTPQQHWWGDVAEVPSSDGAAAAAPAATPASSGWAERPSWPSPEQHLAMGTSPSPPPGSAGTPARALTQCELEQADRDEMVAWLVEMGFPEPAAREAAPRHTCSEEIVEDLLARGIRPSIDAAGGVPVDDVTLSLRRVSLGAHAASRHLEACSPTTPSPGRPALAFADNAYPEEDDTVAYSMVYDAPRATPEGGGGGGDTTPAPDAEERGLGVTSFVQVDGAPSSSALECLPYAEHHVLLWESKELRVLGNALGRIAASEALALTASTALKHTFLASLMAACATPAFLIKACDVLDNPWAIGFARAQRAGALLAEVLLEREHGARPVILVGFGLGARLLYDALIALAEALEGGDGRAAGVVQHVVLMGLPATCEPEKWGRIRKVAAGRLVNCYRPNDLVLSMVHRAANLALGVAGLSEVQATGVENYDVSGIVSAHHKYRHSTGAVLEMIGLDEFVGEEAGRPAAKGAAPTP
mmetsp:Transcript_24192/g.61898  ORF Transcript_24192/g.61898 Transcript_24192/m.61898 type:complete len:863 (+) Transcript_24192:99-2687(+)